MKAVILARVSTEMQEDGFSLDAQLDRLRNYCLLKRLEIAKEFKLLTGLIYTENCFITKPLSSNKLRNLVALRISVLVRTGMSNIQIIHIIDHPVRVSSRRLRAIPENLMFLFDFAEWCQFNFTCFMRSII